MSLEYSPISSIIDQPIFPAVGMALRTFIVKTKLETIDDATGHWIAAVNFRKSSQFDEVLWTLWEQVDELYSLEIFAHRQHTQLCVTADESVMDKIQGALYVMVTDAEFIDIPDPMGLVGQDDLIATNEYGLKRESLLALQTFENIKHDPVAPILNIISGLPFDQKIYLQWVTRKMRDDWKFQLNVKLQKYFWLSRFPFEPIHWFRPKIMERFEKAIIKAERQPFAVNLRTAVVASPPQDPEDQEALEQTRASMQRSLTCLFHGLRYYEITHMGSYVIKNRGTGHASFEKFVNRKMRRPFWLSRQELATQWHPIQVNLILNLSETIAAKANPPAQLSAKANPAHVSFIATTEYRNSNIHFGITRPDRKSHLHIIGKSGVGKSKLIQLLAKSDIEHGYGLALIDCHGDLVDELMRLIPENRIHDVALFDVSDKEFPICFNPFASVKEENRNYMANEFLYTLKRMEDLSLSEPVEQLVLQALIATMEAPNTSTLSVLRILTDREYRCQIAKTLSTTSSKGFWSERQAEIDALLESEEIHGVTRLLAHLLSSDLVSFVMGQHENRLDFAKMIEENKIVLVKIPKRNLGRQASVLLGSLVLSLLNVAASERSGHAIGHDIKDFYIYIDEFQNFASPAVSRAVAAGESNHVSYTIAHQMIPQLPREVYDALSARIQNIISFQVGGEDAIALESRLSPPFERSDMANLDARSFYIRMLLNGQLKEAFSARTDDVNYPGQDFVREARESSRLQYARKRTEIQSSIQNEYPQSQFRSRA